MVHLFVSSFGDDTSWIKGQNVYTIEVGMAIRPCDMPIKPNRNSLSDNWGKDNISALNPYFGELTGLYWLWKNVWLGDDEIIGFCHYGKKIDISEEMINKAFLQRERDNLWIVLEPFSGKPNPFFDDRQILHDVLSEMDDKRYIRMYDAHWDIAGKAIHGEKLAHGGQMFYTTVSQFKDYCEFLFGVLLEVQNRIGAVERSDYYTRYCAFMGEGLLPLYLLTNEKRLINCPIKYNDSTAYTIARKMANRVHLNRESKLYIKIRDHLGKNRKSSYKV